MTNKPKAAFTFQQPLFLAGKQLYPVTIAKWQSI